jgi:AcrR family transcriptional regulator
MNNSFAVQSRLDAKKRLIKAGLEIFGTFNLEGATTRQLAQRAGVNQAAIPYYFGGKEGLYLAVIEHLITIKLVGYFRFCFRLANCCNKSG